MVTACERFAVRSANLEWQKQRKERKSMSWREFIDSCPRTKSMHQTLPGPRTPEDLNAEEAQSRHDHFARFIKNIGIAMEVSEYAKRAAATMCGISDEEADKIYAEDQAQLDRIDKFCAEGIRNSVFVPVETPTDVLQKRIDFLESRLDLAEKRIQELQMWQRKIDPE